MFIDAFNLFTDKEDITASGVSTNVIDTKADDNLGVGEPMAVVVVLPQGSDDGDADETYSVEVQASSDEAFTSPKSVISKSIPAGLPAGSKVVIGIPADDSGDQYYRLNYALSGTTPALNGASAFLIPQSMIQNDYVYASGFSVAD